MTQHDAATEAQIKELTALLSDPIIMADLAYQAKQHPRATEEEKAILILMTIIARMTAAPEKGIPRSEAKKIGKILWDQLLAIGLLTGEKVLRTIERLATDFPPTTNEQLREEMLEQLRRELAIDPKEPSA